MPVANASENARPGEDVDDRRDQDRQAGPADEDRPEVARSIAALSYEAAKNTVNPTVMPVSRA